MEINFDPSSALILSMNKIYTNPLQRLFWIQRIHITITLEDLHKPETARRKVVDLLLYVNLADNSTQI